MGSGGNLGLPVSRLLLAAQLWPCRKSFYVVTGQGAESAQIVCVFASLRDCGAFKIALRHTCKTKENYGESKSPEGKEIKCWPFFDMASPRRCFLRLLLPHAFISLCTIFGLSPAPVMLICTPLCECASGWVSAIVSVSVWATSAVAALLAFCVGVGKVEWWRLPLLNLSRYPYPSHPHSIFLLRVCACVWDPNIVNPIDLC